MTNSISTKLPPLTNVQWLICVIAAIGFAFDTYVLLMLPLILRPALEQLGGLQFGSPEYARWRDLMFYVPAVCGGILGLLGGYLTDLSSCAQRSSSWEDYSLAVLNMLVGATSCFMCQQSVVASWAFWAGI